jgi:NAD(P)H-dependent FMN reductase
VSEGSGDGEKPQIGIIVGSTRPGRLGEAVAKWVLEIAGRRTDAAFRLVDLLEHPLPPLDEPIPPSLGRYAHDHTKAWARTIGALDGFVFVTAEYNHGPPAALKNAIDYLYAEWNNKAAGFVSYGSSGGVRAVEHLRLVLAELQVATVRAQVPLLLATDFVDYREFRPSQGRDRAVSTMLDQVVAWSRALRPLRAPASGGA